jgi:hypothetical protein
MSAGSSKSAKGRNRDEHGVPDWEDHFLDGYWLMASFNHFKNLAYMSEYAKAKGTPSPKLAARQPLVSPETSAESIP